MTTEINVPRWRRYTFSGIAGLLLLMIVGLLGPALIDIVLAWLPVDVWQSIYGTEEVHAGSISHRIHMLAMTALFWGLVIGVAVQLWKPTRREAPMLLAVAVALGFLVFDLVGGIFSPEEEIPLIALVLLLAALHPSVRSFFRFRRPNAAMTGMAVVAAVPGAFFVVDQIGKQRIGLAGDEHTEFGHWAVMAVFATVLVAWALIAATDRTGWRLASWIAGLSAALYGIGSLVFAGYPSAASTFWAVAAIVWGGAFIAIAEMRSRRTEAGDGARAVSSPTEARLEV